MKVIADDKIPFLRGVLEPFLDIEYVPGKDISREMLHEVDALLIRTRTRCNKELLEGTSVSFIATATIGYDHIDTDYCKKQGITWTNAPGCNSGSVLQYVASALLLYSKQNNIDLSQRVMGVVGVGNVGSKIVKLAEILGMQVILCDPPRARREGACGFMSLEGIKREADIISMHVPLNLVGEDITHHLVDDNFLTKLNDDTLLINSSRGEVVSTESLKRELRQKKLTSIIDVWENEPTIDSELLDLAYIATPHIAGYSADGKANGTQMSVQALSRFFNLGLDNWEPDEIPLPDSSEIHCNGLNKSFQEILTEVVLQTYDITIDNSWLRNDIGRFELYRSNYPIRREFRAFKIKCPNIKDDDKKKLRKLGFKII